MKKLTILALAGCSVFASADFTQNFDDITTLAGSGWSTSNQSTTIGTTNWFQGNPDVFVAHSGATNSYIGANFNNTTGTNTISNWLVTQQTSLSNGSTFSFWTRTVSAPSFSDRLQVRMSTNGASTNTGAGATGLGDFTTLLLDINPTYVATSYPNTWTQFNVVISGLGAPTSGRLAFRYFVENGGPAGTNSDFMGIDTVSYTDAVPEPATMVVLGGLAVAAIRRKRK